MVESMIDEKYGPFLMVTIQNKVKVKHPEIVFKSEEWGRLSALEKVEFVDLIFKFESQSLLAHPLPDDDENTSKVYLDRHRFRGRAKNYYAIKREELYAACIQEIITPKIEAVQKELSQFPSKEDKVNFIYRKKAALRRTFVQDEKYKEANNHLIEYLNQEIDFWNNQVDHPSSKVTETNKEASSDYTLDNTQRLLIIELLKEQGLFPKKTPHIYDKDHLAFVGALLGKDPKNLKKGWESVHGILNQGLTSKQKEQRKKQILKVRECFNRIAPGNDKIVSILKRIDDIIDISNS